MKFILAICLMLSITPIASAQGIGNASVRHFAGAPTGGCSANQFGINDASGALYDCKAGAWNAIGTGTLSGSLTATRIPYASGASTLVDSANLTYAAGTLALAGTDGTTSLSGNTVTIDSSASLNPAFFILKAGTDNGASDQIQWRHNITNDWYMVTNDSATGDYEFALQEGTNFTYKLFSKKGTNGATYLNESGGNVGIGVSTAGTPAFKLDVNGTVGGTSFTGASYLTATNCADSAGAAACGSAAAGGVVIDAAATSVVVSTTAVTANSEILIQDDSSLSTRLSVTCNTQALTVLGVPTVTARTAGASFTITIAVGPTTNPLCLNYSIVN